MRSVRIPAEIILTFPANVAVTEEVFETAAFACEQHFNSIGMINYKGEMLQTGTLSFGVRVHFGNPINTGNMSVKKVAEMLKMGIVTPPDALLKGEVDEPENG